MTEQFQSADGKMRQHLIHIEAERLEAARLEVERLEVERLEAERLAAKLLESEQLAAQKLEQPVLNVDDLEVLFFTALAAFKNVMDAINGTDASRISKREAIEKLRDTAPAGSEFLIHAALIRAGLSGDQWMRLCQQTQVEWHGNYAAAWFKLASERTAYRALERDLVQYIGRNDKTRSVETIPAPYICGGPNFTAHKARVLAARKIIAPNENPSSPKAALGFEDISPQGES